jgi:hypothetical protein
MKRGAVITLAVLFVCSLAFASNELNISPYATTNTSNVSLILDATNYTAVWTNITFPDGETTLINNQTNITFTNTSLIGRYNVTYFVNDSEGNVTNITDYFEIFAPYTFLGNIMGYNETNINYSYNFYYRENVLFNDSLNTSFSLEVPDTVCDLGYTFFFNDLQLYFSEINSSQSNNTISVDNITAISGYYINYAINSTYNITNTTIKIYYGNLSFSDESMLNLYKCLNWSHINKTCLGTWTNITSNLIQDTTNNLFKYSINSTINFALGINETAVEEEEEEEEEEEDPPAGDTPTVVPTTVPEGENTPTDDGVDSGDESNGWDLSDFTFTVGEDETIEIISNGGIYQIIIGDITYNISIYNITDDGANFDIGETTYSISFHETKEFTIDEHAIRISYLEKSEDKVKISFSRMVSGIKLEASPIFGAIYEFVGGVLARNMVILITITILTAIISHRDNPSIKKKKKITKKKSSISKNKDLSFGKKGYSHSFP